MKLLVVATALGPLGSGRGGGVELTLAGLVAGSALLTKEAMLFFLPLAALWLLLHKKRQIKQQQKQLLSKLQQIKQQQMHLQQRQKR